MHPNSTEMSRTERNSLSQSSRFRRRISWRLWLGVRRLLAPNRPTGATLSFPRLIRKRDGIAAGGNLKLLCAVVASATIALCDS